MIYRIESCSARRKRRRNAIRRSRKVKTYLPTLYRRRLSSRSEQQTPQVLLSWVSLYLGIPLLRHCEQLTMRLFQTAQVRETAETTLIKTGPQYRRV